MRLVETWRTTRVVREEAGEAYCSLLCTSPASDSRERLGRLSSASHLSNPDLFLPSLTFPNPCVTGTIKHVALVECLFAAHGQSISNATLLGTIKVYPTLADPRFFLTMVLLLYVSFIRFSVSNSDVPHPPTRPLFVPLFKHLLSSDSSDANTFYVSTPVFGIAFGQG